MKNILVPFAALVAIGSATTPSAAPADAFMGRLSSLCGQAYAGRIVSPPVDADASFAGKALVMHVRECGGGEIRIPFHVGADRSRTWVVTRTDAGVRLKHDHRHEDGSEDALTQYGGDSDGQGTETRQRFPADSFSRHMFVTGSMAQSAGNVWALGVEPGRTFAYELRRPGRFFRVEFDLTRPVPSPPPPWGAR